MDRNEISHDPHHLGVPSGASKMIFEPRVRLAQSVHLSCTNINNISNGPNEIPDDPCYLGVPLGASKIISEAYGTFSANLAPMLCQD